MRSTLTKVDIANRLYIEVGLNRKEAKQLIEIMFERMRELLEQGHHLKLSGFGNFYLRDKTARPGRNPKTGEDAEISERRVVTFHAGQKLKARAGAL